MNQNQAQQEAIAHREGPMLVLAGPGSGKTMVVTHRVQKLIESGVSPSNILVITFTRAAAMEMQERFTRLSDGRRLPVTFGTFHSVFFHILKYAYNYNAAHILREEEKLACLREIIKGIDMEIEDEGDFLSSIIGEISFVKGEMVSLEHYYSKNCSEQIFKQIYEQYEQALRRAGRIDFDDMLVFCYELFRERPDILALWQKKYQYILIDEFQDICKVQYDIMRMLAAPENNLFIVGDDDQSIYRFRGARPEIMQNFLKDYPKAKQVLLNVNYRSDAAILEAAGRLIGHNKVRFPKEIDPFHPKKNKVITQGFVSPTEENIQILKDIAEYRKAGYEYTDMAIITRTNSNPRQLVGKLMEYNLPFCMRDMVPNLYDHWIAANLFSYMKIAMGDRSRGEFLKIANRPNRYLKRDCFYESQVSFEQLYQYYEGKDWMIERIERLEYDIAMLKKMKPYAAINYIRKGIGYEEYLREYAEYRRMKPEELMDILDELQESAKEFASYEDWFQYIEEYTEELKQQKDRLREKGQGITISTMHSAKGLEYPIVFLPDVNEGVIPHKKAVLESEIEEERRLFYVAMTRAGKHLHIYYTKERYCKDQEPSPFIEEYLKM